MESQRTLTLHEKRGLAFILNSTQDTIVLVHGEGKDRAISFYAEGTRNEARISYPDVVEKIE